VSEGERFSGLDQDVGSFEPLRSALAARRHEREHGDEVLEADAPTEHCRDDCRAACGSGHSLKPISHVLAKACR